MTALTIVAIALLAWMLTGVASLAYIMYIVWKIKRFKRELFGADMNVFSEWMPLVNREWISLIAIGPILFILAFCFINKSSEYVAYVENKTLRKKEKLIGEVCLKEQER